MTVVVGLRMAARRPAAWLACAAAVTCGGLLAAAGGQFTPIALVCGVLVAIAAVGDPPPVAPAVALPAVVWWSPLAWPLVGAVAAATVAGAPGRTMATAIAAAAIVTTASRQLIGHVVRGGKMAADHAATDRPLQPTAVTAWMADDANRGPLARVALATSLIAMAVCFFLDPDRAGWYALVAAAWFVALTLPIAAIAGGGSDERARGRLIASAAGPPPGSRGHPLPGTLPHAIRGLVTHAVLLAWPAVVATLIWAGRVDRIGGPLAAIGVLAGLTAGTAGLLATMRLCGANGDTTRGSVACALAVAAAALLPRPPFLPSLRIRLEFEAMSVTQVGVEGLRPTCKTPQSPQSPGSSRPLAIVTDVAIDGVEKSGAAARY